MSGADEKAKGSGAGRVPPSTVVAGVVYGSVGQRLGALHPPARGRFDMGRSGSLCVVASLGPQGSLY